MKNTVADEVMAEEVVKIEWEQLPQRAIWTKLQSSPDKAEYYQQRERNHVPIGAPRTAQRPAEKQSGGWEYLDHTADIQIHSWGANMEEAFGSCIVAMFAYMVEIDEIDNELEMEFVAEGHDLPSLLFNTLDECLYIFHTENFVMKQVIFRVLSTDKFQIAAVARGGLFDATQHSHGTEVKAITYSNMQILHGDDRENVETYVIVDI